MNNDINNKIKTVKVSVYDPIFNNILKTYVFLNDHSKQLYHAANSISLQHNSKLSIPIQQEKILSHEFGAHWKHYFIPNIIDIDHDIINTIGSGPGNSSLGDVYSDILGQILSDTLDINEDIKISDADIESSDIGDKLFEDQLDRKNKKQDSSIEITNSKVLTYNGNKIEIAKTKLTYEDSMMVVKEKIYLETLIPPFRQHLFWIIDDEIFTTYEINLMESGNDVNIDIRTLKENEKIEGNLYSDKSLYKLKNEIKIIPRDTFILLSQLHSSTGSIQLYVVDLQLFIQPNKKMLVNIINDKYKIDYIYYGFILKYYPLLPRELFRNYIINENEIPVKYPKLSPSKTILSRKYDTENDIISNATDYIDSDNKSNYIHNSLKKYGLTMGISKLTIEITGRSIVNLRNLFDIIEINNIIPEAHAYLTYEDQHYFIKKTYKYLREDLSTRFPVDMREGVVIMVTTGLNNNNNKDKDKLNNDNITLINTIYINFLSNGNYKIKTSFDDDTADSFDHTLNYIKKIVNPIIQEINLYKSKLFNTNTEYDLVNATTVNYKSLDIAIFWKKTLLDNEFRSVRDIWNIFVSAGMIIDRTYTQNFEFVFAKGMHVFDEGLMESLIKLTHESKNYYAYLINPDIAEKWNDTFGGKHVKMIHRTTDVKFELINLVESEYYIFYKYLLYVIASAQKILKHDIHDKPQSQSSGNLKKLKKLREYDPVLYNLHKYGLTTNYSILCQNPTQPLILTDDEVSRLSKNKKDKLTKYWNFTLKKPAYYTCPSEKYPHLNFIVGVHPLKYCMPCCKKIKSKEESKKTLIYNSCLSDHNWDHNNKMEIMKSSHASISDDLTRYITVFGKEIGPGRLSRLPIELSKLLENTLSNYKKAPKVSNPNVKFKKRITNESYAKLGYYLFGIDKGYDIYTMELNSFINTLIHGLHSNDIINNYKLSDYLDEFLNAKDTPIIYKQLLNGRLLMLMKSFKEYQTCMQIFIKKLSALFPAVHSNNITSFNKKYKPFLMTISELSKIFNNKISQSILIELITEILSRMNIVNIIVCINETYDNQIETTIYINPYIRSVTNFSDTTVKYLLMNKHNNAFVPIYIISPDDYFYDGSIYKKLFTIVDTIMITISMIIATIDNSFKSDINDKLIDLEFMKQFMIWNNERYKQNDKIILKYISNYNMCYGILIDTYIGRYYIPINFSQNINDSIPSSLDLPQTNVFKRMNLKFSTLYKYIQRINDFISTGKHKILNLKKYKLIMINNMITTDNDSTNEFFHERQIFKFGLQDGNFDKMFRDSIKIEMKHDLDDVNLSIKNMIPPLKDKTNTDLSSAFYNNLKYQLFTSEFLSYLKKEKNNKIRNKLLSLLLRKNTHITALTNEINDLLKEYPSDYNLIKQFIHNYFKKDKNKLLSIISNYLFSFDNITLSNLHKLDKNDIKQSLKQLVKHFTTIKKIDSNIDFPNIFIPCGTDKTSTPYCDGRKLIIEDVTILNELIDLLASDIINPMKYSYMMKNIQTENIIDYFKFDRSDDVIIMIENQSI